MNWRMQLPQLRVIDIDSEGDDYGELDVNVDFDVDIESLCGSLSGILWEE